MSEQPTARNLQDQDTSTTPPEDRTLNQVQADRAPSSSPLPQIDGYEVLRELGKGGMGVVYLARQVRADRVVALKMIRDSAFAEPEDVARFQLEARAAAGLNHPNIARVYEVGESAGRPYFVLEYVEGERLDRRIGGTPQHPRFAAQFVETLARAMQAAHDHHIVHRDLKPANILLTGDGTPKITDFGLAKRLDTPAGLTPSAAVLGTPSYMAPEQASGRSRAVGPTADVYALGAILYEMLTGRPPFLAETAMDTMLMVLIQDPVPPSRLSAGVPRDLETICLKCLRKEPDQRYATATALADDLHRFLHGLPVHARPLSAAERGWRWCRRKPIVAGLLAAVVLSLLSGFGAVLWQWSVAERERGLKTEALNELQGAYDNVTEERNLKEVARRQALDRAHDLEEANRRLKTALNTYGVALAYREWLADNVAEAERILDGSPAELRHWEWHYLKRLCHCELLTYRGHKQSVTCLAYTPDGKHIVSGSSDRTAQLWDPQTGQTTHTFTGHPGLVNGLAIAHSHPWLAVACSSENVLNHPGEVRIWDVDTGQPITTLRTAESAQAVAFSPDDRDLAAGIHNGEVKIYTTRTWKPKTTLTGHLDSLASVVYSPDGKYLATADDKGMVRVWDAGSGKSLVKNNGGPPVTSLAFHPHKPVLAIADVRGRIQRVDVEKVEEIGTLIGSEDSLRWVAFDRNGEQLAAAGYDQAVRIWHDPGSRPTVLRGHTGPVWCVAFSPDGKRLASSSMDGTVKIWDTNTEQESRPYHGHEGPVLGVALARGEQVLLSGSGDATAAAWDLASGKLLYKLEPKAGPIWCVAASRDGSQVATAETKNTVTLWDARTGAQLRRLTGHQDYVWFVAWSPVDSRLASASQDGTIRIWYGNNGNELAVLAGHRGSVESVAFSPGGRRLVSAGYDGTVRLWDLATGEPLFTFECGSPVMSVAWSPDGIHVASAGLDRVVSIWDARDGRRLHELHGHPGPVWSVAFTPDGSRLASVSADSNIKMYVVRDREKDLRYDSGRGQAFIKLWEVNAGVEVFTLRLPTPEAPSLAFSPEGNLLAVATGSSVRVWDARPK